MRIELLFIFIMLLIFLFIGKALNAKQIKSEKYYQKKYCSSIGATIEARVGRVKIDCLTKDYAIEVDFAKKWASRGVIAVEMECAGIFSVGLMRGIKTASLLLVSDSLVEDLGFADAKVLNKYADKAAEVALDALTKVKV